MAWVSCFASHHRRSGCPCGRLGRTVASARRHLAIICPTNTDTAHLMSHTSIFIPGDYEDAFLYMGRLIAIRIDGTLVYLDFDRAVSEISAQPEASTVLRLLFERND